jgi:hypothetical protein
MLTFRNEKERNKGHSCMKFLLWRQNTGFDSWGASASTLRLRLSLYRYQ